jgi:hypothetical protein
LLAAQFTDRVQQAAAARAVAVRDVDQDFITRQVRWQGAVVAIGTRLPPPPRFARPCICRVLRGLVGGKALLQVLQSQLQLLAAQLLGTTTELMAQQTLDQQAQLVDFGITLAHRALQLCLLLFSRGDHLAQHTLQGLRVIRQGGKIDRHTTSMTNALASPPMNPA